MDNANPFVMFGLGFLTGVLVLSGLALNQAQLSNPKAPDRFERQGEVL